MKKVSAYQCPGGILETDPKRAAAWNLYYCAKDAKENVSFSSALWIIENKDIVIKLINEYDLEINK
jgi:hypothetical protein